MGENFEMYAAMKGSYIIISVQS